MTGDDLRSRTLDSSTRFIITAAEAFALADLIDAVRTLDPLGEHRPFPTIPTQCADCLNTWPCPTERARRALTALDADR